MNVKKQVCDSDFMEYIITEPITLFSRNNDYIYFLTHCFFELAILHVFAFWSVFPSSEISIHLLLVLKKINFQLKSPGYFKGIFHFTQGISYSVLLAVGVYFILILWYFRELFFNPVKTELNSTSNNSTYPERNHIWHIFKKSVFQREFVIWFPSKRSLYKH